jgi:hypothetical protein
MDAIDPAALPPLDPALAALVRRVYADLKAMLADYDLDPGTRANAVAALAAVWQIANDLGLEYEMLYDLDV